MAHPSVIGVDAGGTKVLTGVVDPELAVRHRIHRTWPSVDRSAVLDLIAGEVERAHGTAPEADAGGVGIPALLDEARGVSLASVHLPLDGVPFRDLMAERLGLPVYVDNDANLAALVEQRYGAARGASDVVLLTLGTGIGGGLVLGGRLYRGSVGAGAELGHMVVDLDGPPCQGSCPNRGCLETMASGRAIGRFGLEEAREQPGSALGRALADGRRIDGALVTLLARKGDPAAREVLARAGRNLGVGIASLVNILNPEVVVVGGGVIAAGDLLLEPAREELERRALRPSLERVRVVPARFGEDAGMLGAATLALADGRV